jgi:hypothetical protein
MHSIACPPPKMPVAPLQMSVAPLQMFSIIPSTYHALISNSFRAEKERRTLAGLASVGVDGGEVWVAMKLHFAGTIRDLVETREEVVQQMGDIYVPDVLRPNGKPHSGGDPA